MSTLENFVKERNEALFSLDRNRIEAYLAKHGDATSENASDMVFWAGVYKAICRIKDAPEDVLKTAYNWLNENGFSIPS